MIDKNCISTINCKRFNPIKAEPDDIVIEDIVHALSLICRANGHFKMFYSIAQHSINCAMEARARGLSTEVQLWCLLHDASEAYIGDVTRPLKRQLTEYIDYEKDLQSTILKALDISEPNMEEQSIIKEIDDCLLYHEFKTYHGDALLEEIPEIHIILPREEIHHSNVREQFIGLYNALKIGEKGFLSVGIDGCKGQWIAAALSSTGIEIHKFKSIDEICEHYKDADSMIIDIPIGLPDSKENALLRPDNALRKLLKGKTSSVFNVPCRQAVYAEEKQTAKKVNIQVMGKSLSEQSLAIIPAIKQVDMFLQNNAEWKNHLKEGHPEYGFAVLNGGNPVMSKKRTREGFEDRIKLLEKYCSYTQEAIKNQNFKDDVIDAMCLAIIGELGLKFGFITVPEIVGKDSEGLNMSIVVAKSLVY